MLQCVSSVQTEHRNFHKSEIPDLQAFQLGADMWNKSERPLERVSGTRKSQDKARYSPKTLVNLGSDRHFRYVTGPSVTKIPVHSAACFR
mmetsp:Transcript_28367/g.71193  ORF Transcript_28367/g.71193 Transcript_28367/m.71193 type:complete len:90 (+) Transcript_28367:876-1145(+)